jgi:aspartyl-tRNA(Asn)/glutamyl-tRNA(Gln) amidotransferase subunit C
MPEEISPELFNHLVDLAALELTPEEGDYLRRQMNNQLQAIHELGAIPLEAELTPASHGISYSKEMSAQFRKDEWIPSPDPGKLLRQAPETDDGYVVVPEIPHKDLD